MNYSDHPRIKPFILALARKAILEQTKQIIDKVKRIHTDGFIVSVQANLETNGYMLGGLKLKKRGNVKIKNVNNITWSLLEILPSNKSEITCKVSQSEDITVKKTNQTPRIFSPTFNNQYVANEILTEIFEYLKKEEKKLRIFHLNNALLVNHQWYECALWLAYEKIKVEDTSVGILDKKFEKDKAPLWAKHVRSIKINHII